MTGYSPREPFGRRPLPVRADWRRALDVYRGGRSRVLTFDEKRRIATEETSPAEGPAEAGTRAGSARPARTTAPGYGVPVPETFVFHRNAGNWRNRLPRERTRSDAATED